MPESIPIHSIFPGLQHRLRRIRDDKVQALSESIREIGLQSPISLRAVPCTEGVPTPHCYKGNTYHIVAGQHRLEACKKLGWKEIPALILEADEAVCRLWEIDENLVRAELTDLEQAEHLRERKFWYERLHQQTTHGGNRVPSGQFGHTGDTPSFVEDTAQQTGMSERDVRRSVHRAEAIAPEVKEAIHDMPGIADKGVELDALAAVEPEAQKAAVEAVKSGKARNVREATKKVRSLKRKGSKPRQPRSDEETLRREVKAAVKRYQEKAAGRLAGILVNCTESSVQIAIRLRGE